MKQLKEEHQNLTLDYQQLRSDHQNLTLNYQQLRSDHQNVTLGQRKLEENHDQLKNLMYTYMGGCFKCLVFTSKNIIKNWKLTYFIKFYIFLNFLYNVFEYENKQTFKKHESYVTTKYIYNIMYTFINTYINQNFKS